MSEEKPFYIYRVLETNGITADELQQQLNDLTDDEFQIKHTVGTKIILQTESILNRKGRLEARAEKLAASLRGGLGPASPSIVPPINIQVNTSPNKDFKSVLEETQKDLSNALKIPKELL